MHTHQRLGALGAGRRPGKTRRADNGIRICLACVSHTRRGTAPAPAEHAWMIRGGVDRSERESMRWAVSPSLIHPTPGQARPRRTCWYVSPSQMPASISSRQRHLITSHDLLRCDTVIPVRTSVDVQMWSWSGAAGLPGSLSPGVCVWAVGRRQPKWRKTRSMLVRAVSGCPNPSLAYLGA